MKTILASLILAVTLVPAAFCDNPKDDIKKEEPAKQPAEEHPTETHSEKPTK